MALDPNIRAIFMLQANTSNGDDRLRGNISPLFLETLPLWL
jgi:hypothetical protein